MILDHKEGLKLAYTKAKKHHNELAQLRVLREGLIYLNTLVTGLMEKGDNANASGSPSLPGGVSPEPLIGCAFDWYSLSACNFVGLIGWLAEKRDHKLREYIHDVLGSVLIYRNKVAAHFAKVDPHGEDTRATVFASTIPSVSRTDRVPCVGAWKVTTGSHGHVTESVDWRWSLPETHIELAKRYWPESREGNQKD